MLKLNDVWRNVNTEIGFYTKERFDQVPAGPGVYAWFYPLRIVTKDPYEFISEVNTVLNYDAYVKGEPVKESEVKFAWKTIILKMKLNFRKPNLESFISIWNEAVKHEQAFNKLRQIIMKASIFISPLYVGKTNRLQQRCLEHVSGNDRINDFHKRYTEFARSKGIRGGKVSDLLFVSIKTIDETLDESNLNIENLECLVEEIMKYLSKPIYSIK